MNHITKKPKSLGKRKRWEQRATSKVVITQPSVEGCSYQSLTITPSSKVTSGFKSNLTPIESKFADIKPATPNQRRLGELQRTHITPKPDKVEYQSHLTSFDEVAYQKMVTRWAR